MQFLRTRRAFTLLEVTVVVVLIGIMAAVVIPKFGSVADDARSGAVQGTVAGVRSGIAGFRSKAVLSGTAPFPTLAQLTTLGTVMQTAVPANPYNNLATVQAVTLAQANARTVVGSAGWNYYVDNASTPPVAVFYANSAQATTVSNGAGAFKTANQL